MAQGPKSVKLDIIRETGNIHDKHASWLNRFVQDPGTNEILYYCESGPDHKITIHRGGKDGPVIATGDPCLRRTGQTDVHFQLDEEKFTISLTHKHHLLPSFHSKTSFVANGKPYHWQSHNDLYDEQASEVIATFKSTWLEGTCHKIGTLEISTQHGNQDLIVITALVVQERSDEHRLSAQLAKERAMEMNLGGY